MALVILIAIMAGSPTLKNMFHTHGVLHPWFHLLVFTLVGFSAMFCSDRRSTRFVLMLGLMFFGLCTEFAEHMVNNVPVERVDVLYDFVGVALGCIAGWIASTRAADERTITQ